MFSSYLGGFCLSVWSDNTSWIAQAFWEEIPGKLHNLFPDKSVTV